jgi:fructoselysine-6-phosphate deglycase
VVHCRGEYDDALRVVDELQVLPEGLMEAKRGFEAQAEELAQKLQEEPYHIMSGAGLTWPEALYYGMCILEEMQWIRTRPVHASDFFHGTLELVEPDVSVILLKGEDASRPLVERVERFAARYTEKLTVLDTARVPLLSAHLEVKRNHPLTTRRYYRRVQY